MSVTTSKQVNVSQLAVEMGRVPLRCVGPDAEGKTIVIGDVTDAAIKSAIDAHTANPNWVDPNAPAPAPTRAQKIDTAKKQVAAIQAGPIRDSLLAIIEALA